jgi:hypothetical protein
MINNPALITAIREAYKRLPELDAYLSAATIRILSQVDEFKSYDYFLRHIRGLVNGVYSGNVGGEFVDVMANLISGQLQDAYNKAWIADGNELPLPDYLEKSYQEAVSNQYGFVDQFYRDIVDARIDGTSKEPLLVRADMWANRFNEATSEAARLMALENGGKLVWRYGEAEHCSTCQTLNGVVAYAKEWEISGLKPQNAPNDFLECGGWNCKCRLEPTDRRRSPKVLDTLLNIGAR